MRTYHIFSGLWTHCWACHGRQRSSAGVVHTSQRNHSSVQFVAVSFMFHHMFWCQSSIIMSIAAVVADDIIIAAKLKDSSIALHFYASMISGLVTTVASMPIDIIKTRCVAWNVS